MTTVNCMITVKLITCEHIYSDRCQVTADVELIPEGEDTQPDSPLEDTVAVTLKRETSIRRSQRNGRSEGFLD